jgi:hypothetical protein
LQALLFLWGAFGLDDIIQLSKNEGIHLSSGKFDLEFIRAMIHEFCFRDWCVSFRVLSNPIEDLLLPILIEEGMFSSLPGLVLAHAPRPLAHEIVDNRKLSSAH